jgi:hypothetical protein
MGFAFLAALALFSSSCTKPTAPEAPATTDTPPWPGRAFSAPGDDRRLFRLDPDSSRIDIVVRRDGPLARFGHDHVIVARNMEGHAADRPDGQGRVARLRLPVAAFEVDPAAARERYALDTEPDAADIAATRNNLMERVLQASNWPHIDVDVRNAWAMGEERGAEVALWVKGRPYTISPAFRGLEKAGGLHLSGFLEIEQTALGITPFSALGGGLRVADTLEIHYELSFRVKKTPPEGGVQQTLLQFY